ncbi:hypothetical protein PHYBOEH_012113 [Phytophthora boehmeriae]|uniref:Uncharacterized protein n=1 Tax=Phytophthora boehmeriae TaxID=109152 RepID=A0A8T1VCJ8_9STRA|nr:hypothetical protein PHYBOEH_012113 [Phytophthora boehmeriae]
MRWSELPIDYLAANGHWDIIRWLFERDIGTLDKRQASRLLTFAIEQSRVADIKWPIACGYTELATDLLNGSEDTSWTAVKELVLYVLREKCDTFSWEEIARPALLKAAQTGDLAFIQQLADILQLLHRIDQSLEKEQETRTTNANPSTSRYQHWPWLELLRLDIWIS